MCAALLLRVCVPVTQRSLRPRQVVRCCSRFARRRARRLAARPARQKLLRAGRSAAGGAAGGGHPALAGGQRAGRWRVITTMRRDATRCKPAWRSGAPRAPPLSRGTPCAGRRASCSSCTWAAPRRPPSASARERRRPQQPPEPSWRRRAQRPPPPWPPARRRPRCPWPRLPTACRATPFWGERPRQAAFWRCATCLRRTHLLLGGGGSLLRFGSLLGLRRGLLAPHWARRSVRPGAGRVWAGERRLLLLRAFPSAPPSARTR